MAEQELFAFWRYDSGFGWLKKCLCGKIEKFNESGSVYIPSYQASFFPFKILPMKQALEIKARLDVLEVQYRNELKELKEKYDKLHDEIIKVPKRDD